MLWTGHCDMSVDTREKRTTLIMSKIIKYVIIIILCYILTYFTCLIFN